MSLPDYYALLNLPTNASQVDIKRAYRRLARKYHPDLRRPAADQADILDRQIKLLNEAYKVLSNPQQRAAYDRQRRKEQQRLAMQAEVQRQRARTERVKREPKMTWMEGVFGFVRELKKGMREE